MKVKLTVEIPDQIDPNTFEINSIKDTHPTAPMVVWPNDPERRYEVPYTCTTYTNAKIVAREVLGA